ncbi:MAG: aminoglycoside phosphotransferase family protein [Firmicutes bacterium]|nr:aminoglycoside phosphotransferase family protein [Bacillota bacterium]
MRYAFTDHDIENITREFSEGFLQKIESTLEIYCERWQLTTLQLVQYFSVNCIFLCHSKTYGDCVLKICDNSPEWYMREYNALREYNGRRHCRMLDADLENGVLLIERIMPGTQLKQEPSLDKRLSVFLSLFEGLHVAPEAPGLYPTYFDTLAAMVEFMNKQEGHERLRLCIEKATELYREITSVYNQKALLHGDLHYDNILLGSGGEYVIIDPQGLIGDPVFDLSRYLVNEYWDNSGTSPGERKRYMLGIFDVLARGLCLPRNLPAKLFFIDMALVSCWAVEDGGWPGYDESALTFAEDLMM